MFVAWRDLKVAKGRFALIATVVTLITVLVTFLAGLTGGLAAQNISALTSLDADRMVLATAGDEQPTFADSVVTQQDADAWAGQAGVTDVKPLGISTALATAAHEVPQELGDAAILIRAGYSRTRALSLNLLSAIGGLAGALAVYFTLGHMPTVLPYVIAFAAGSFLYVAMSDLIPSLHRGQQDVHPVSQVALISAGLGTLLLV